MFALLQIADISCLIPPYEFNCKQADNHQNNQGIPLHVFRKDLNYSEYGDNSKKALHNDVRRLVDAFLDDFYLLVQLNISVRHTTLPVSFSDDFLLAVIMKNIFDVFNIKNDLSSPDHLVDMRTKTLMHDRFYEFFAFIKSQPVEGEGSTRNQQVW